MDSLINFFDSNFFVALVTLLIGTAAYIDQIDRRISKSAVGIKLKKLANIKPKI